MLRSAEGDVCSVDVGRWCASASAEEREVLGAVEGPVIDLGCGPGRLVSTLAAQGVVTLGVDWSPSAVALARQRGATVLERDVFGVLPGEGRWQTVLLFDGNIGMGGDPARLLRRCRRLASSSGEVMVEVDPPGAGYREMDAWLERDGERSASFAWAVVGAEVVASVAPLAGLDLRMLTTTASGRWFAHLRVAA